MDLEKFYLKSKHWKLFLICVLLSIIMQILMIPTLIMSEDYLIFGIFIGVLGATVVLAFVGWLYFIIKGLSEKIYKGNLKVYRANYRFFVIFPTLYIFIVFTVLPQGFTVSTEGSTVGTMAQVLIIPAHLLSMFCIFFMMYKAAKTIKTVEFQSKVTFGDFAGEFFLLWFFPLGIWIVQPKINNFAE